MRLDRVDYDGRLHSVYAEGRALPVQAAQAWRDAFARWADPGRPLTVRDLGSGTGRFTPALADTFGGPVHGVEPSTRMRGVAHAVAGHPRVRYLDGRAEDIPLPDGTCDLVLVYLVTGTSPDWTTTPLADGRAVRRSWGSAARCAGVPSPRP